ncbi:hypothetical protein [uncultured Lamprocystis sp.]|uniref:hypothetical protein n=1 Tax=uncultured Lamprocystis sp. TaxID=543132 RepID=UPI0025EC5E69|nr:hypothetical protein [uncultured Lamprocystis sp.]
MNATAQDHANARPGPDGFPVPLPVDAIRFSGEAVYAAALRQALHLTVGLSLPAPDPARIRRELMARSLLLSEGMAPAVYAAARECATRFGILSQVEVFQSAGAENAAMHQVDSPGSSTRCCCR